MKKKVLLFIAAWLPMVAFCDKVTVHVETEGTLQEVISDQDVLKITDLTITGRLTNVDIKYLRSGSGRVANLEILDLSGITALVPSDEYYNYRKGDTEIYGVNPITYYKITENNKTLAGAFRDMSIKKIVLPEILTTVGEYGLFNCKNLESVVLPKGLVSIEESAFENSSIESLNLPQGVTSIGWGAFGDCALTTINLENVHNIGNCAFYGCSSLKNIGGLNQIETIGSQAFQKCTSLETVVISDNLKELGKDAFSDCNSLESVTSYIKEPFRLDSPFDSSFLSEGTLYVPARTTSKYRAIYYWNQFVNIVEMEGDYPLGDLTGDYEVNQDDVTALIGYIMGKTDGIEKSIADINEDGEVNIVDVTKLVEIINNMATE